MSSKVYIKAVVYLLILISIILFYGSYCIANESDFVYVAFDQSMQLNDGKKTKDYILFEKLYETNIKSALEGINHCEPIPRVMHQIWLGPNPIPNAYIAATEILKKHHPDWKYKLWRDEDVKNFNFPAKDLYEKAASYTEKSDILRYSILEKFGGVYTDIGYFSIKSLDFLNDHFTFYASVGPQYNINDKLQVISGIIAASKNNQIIEATLEHIRDHWDEVEKEFAQDLDNNNIKLKKSTIVSLSLKRSMYPLKEEIINYIKNQDALYKNCIIVLPPTYLGMTERFRPLDFFYKLLSINHRKMYYSTPQKETIAIKIRLQNKIVSNLSKYKYDAKIPFYKRIYYRIKYFCKSLIDKYYWDFALKKHL